MDAGHSPVMARAELADGTAVSSKGFVRSVSPLMILGKAPSYLSRNSVVMNLSSSFR
jgi:hypothetical protein